MATAGVIGLVWIPLDIDSGVLERARRQVMLGDSFAPLIAVVILALGGLLTLLEDQPAPDTDQKPVSTAGTSPQFTWRSHRDFVAVLLATLTGAAIVVLWTGPSVIWLANLAGWDLPPYRALRDTLPWSGLGFVLGGGGLVAGCIATFEHRASWRAVGVGLLVALSLWAVFDLPFDDLMLPPNADP